MIKLRINKSQQFINEINNYNKQVWNNTIYKLSEKKLFFNGAQNLLNIVIKLLNKNNITYNITYTESQPSVYDKEYDYYWTYTGQIYIHLSNFINRKTKLNIKTISNTLNKVWGYEIILIHKNIKYRL